MTAESRSSGHRRSIRLRGYDYTSPGAYFVTIVAQHRECLFGDIVNGVMQANVAGQMVEDVWNAIPERYPGLATDAFILMPNHVHGIIVVSVGTRLSLADGVHRFKTLTTTRYLAGVNQLGWTPVSARLWQRNYYERVLRDAAELERARGYIVANPHGWHDDVENPSRRIQPPRPA